MFLISTRNFPPELGGMQNLMEGLSNALLNHGPVKVFAEATSVLPLIASDVYHKGEWKKRNRRNFSKIFK